MKKLLTVCALAALASFGCGNMEPAPAPPSGMENKGSAPEPGTEGGATGTREEHEPGKMGQETHDGAEHEHVHKPMFGGRLVELGDHAANIEVTFDKDSGTVTLYVLDAHAEHTTRIAAESIDTTIRPGGGEPYAITLKAVADTLTGETVGDTAKFEASDERIKGIENFEMAVPKIDVKGMVFENVRFGFPN